MRYKEVAVIKFANACHYTKKTDTKYPSRRMLIVLKIVHVIWSNAA